MELTVSVREKLGKSVKSLRKEGFVPAELYGRGVPNLHLAVAARELQKTLKEAGESTVITLRVGSEKHPVLIHDVQENYLTGEVDHVDFYAVRMDERVRAHVPLEFVGEAPAVREKGGVLNKNLSELEVEALPADLPRAVEVHLGGLVELDQSIHVSDLALPAGVAAIVAPTTVVVTAAPPVKEEVAPPPEAVDVSTVKVESEERRREREVEKETQ